jgi:hypothetical protein
MRGNRHLLVASLMASFAFGAVAASAQVTTADYDRALGLRERWEYLTENVADPATWIGDTNRFHYRKTVRGGFEFVLFDAETLEKRPAFDHEKLARALSAATRRQYTATRLPFTSFRFLDVERSIEVSIDGRLWTCGLADYTCQAREAQRPCQPRGFGVVRDLEVPADNRPRRSPDGRWEAFVHNHNLAVRPAEGGTLTVLSSDGSEGNFYDPCSIAWSPDSAKVAVYRVRPGTAVSFTTSRQRPKTRCSRSLSPNSTRSPATSSISSSQSSSTYSR